MKIYNFSIVLVALPLLLAADDRKPSPQGDKEAIQGVWVSVSVQVSGDDTIFGPPPHKVKVTVDKDTVVFQRKDEVRFSYKIDPKADPKQIDLTCLEKKFEGRICLAIYSLKGDELTLCIDERAQKSRPGAFKTSLKDGYSLYKLKREK